MAKKVIVHPVSVLHPKPDAFRKRKPVPVLKPPNPSVVLFQPVTLLALKVSPPFVLIGKARAPAPRSTGAKALLASAITASKSILCSIVTPLSAACAENPRGNKASRPAIQKLIARVIGFLLRVFKARTSPVKPKDNATRSAPAPAAALNPLRKILFIAYLIAHH